MGILFASLASAVLAGCAEFQAAPLPGRPAHMRASRQEKQSLIVAAELHSTPRALQHYFGPELWEAGFFAVTCHFENRGADTFEIERSRTLLGVENPWDLTLESPEAMESDGLSPVAVSEVIAECERSVATAYLLLPLFVAPALVVKNHLERYNFSLSADLHTKALPSFVRLEPADPPQSGALFFRRPTGIGDIQDYLKGAELRLQVDVEGTKVSELDLQPNGSGATNPVPAQATPASAEVGQTISFILTLSESDE